MIVGIGVDIIQNHRIHKALKISKVNFLKKILSKKEQTQLNTKHLTSQHIAGVFAAKEAIIKSLSSFLGFSLNFQEISIQKDKTGFPCVEIMNKSAGKKLLNTKLMVSISHEKYYSVAISIIEKVN